MSSVPPGTILIVAALLVPFLRGRVQQFFLLLAVVASALHMCFFSLPVGSSIQLTLFDLTLTPVSVDRLTLVWGYIFHIAAFIGLLYSLHVRDNVQHVSAMVYIGAAISAVFAGDLLTLFVYWELTALGSVFLIWASRNERAYLAGMRYLVIQVGSGVLLLAGTLIRLAETGSLAFGHLGIESLGGKLIFVAFGIKAAFPLLHNWLQDSYPEATPTGTVILSSFTTKMAIYALARGYAGVEILVWIGAAMTAFPIVYAVIENDLRRVLSYSLNNQLGYMVVGIGIGTPLALDGTASHAFAHILYKALLFMSVGAVLMRTGTAKGSELGGLYKSMPWTATFSVIGGASISAFPLFSGFVSKSLIISAVAEEGYTGVWLVLLFGSAGVFHHSGIKVPFFAFFAHDSGIRVKEAPRNMLLAMGLASALCILLSIQPGMNMLYSILPSGGCGYNPYTAAHVINQMQLLLGAATGFTLLKYLGRYPAELPSANLDTDWVYRRLLPRMIGDVRHVGVDMGTKATQLMQRNATSAVQWLEAEHRANGRFGPMWSTSQIAIWATILLSGYLLLYYLR